LDKNPPKYAIANNFAIGTLPDQFSNMFSDVTSPLLSPIRPFAYIMSYSGGAHKTITRTFTFFRICAMPIIIKPKGLLGTSNSNITVL